MLPEPLFWHVYMYGVMIAVGILCAFLVLIFYSKYKKLDNKLVDFVFYNTIATILFGFFAAAFFQGLYDYIENPDRGFHLDRGITFIGGLIGGAVFFIVVYFILRKKLKIKLLDIVPLAPSMILVGHAFGRLGCFFAGCCHGKQTDSIFGVQFPKLPYKVFPTQLYESIFLFILFAVCSYLYLKKDSKHTMSIYLIAYGIFRFSIEFLRGDHRGELIGIVTPSQFWSILMIGLGIGLYFYIRRINKKEKGTEIKDGKNN